MGSVFVVGVSDQVMDLLLAAKASPWMPNRRQQTPLHVLREAGGVEKLLRARAGVNEQAEIVGVGECWGKGWKGC